MPQDSHSDKLHPPTFEIPSHATVYNMILNILFTVLSCTIISENTVHANAFIKITDTILFSDYSNQSKHACAVYV